MKIKKILVINFMFAILLASVIQVTGSQKSDTTTLEITDIRGGFGGVVTDIKNTGNIIAENFAIAISVKGGLLNNIDILQECSGCGNCGTTIAPGEIKSESTFESGNIIGFGPISVVVTAEADNADFVSMETNGFVIGPLILVF